MLKPEGDDADRKLWRLHKHALAYIPWFYRTKYGSVVVPFETWNRVSMLRGRAFIDAALQLDWEH